MNMKQYILAIVAMMLFVPAVFAGGKDDAKKADKEIHWLNWDEVQVKMKEEPKFVWVDIYTDWCGWCKHMDKTTFSNPQVIEYMNKHFYSVKFDAESTESVRFMGQMFEFDPSIKAHKLAAMLMNGRMSYPTSVLMAENFQSPSPLPGYLKVDQIELYLRFFGDGHYKKETFVDYQKNFTPQWK